MSTNEVPITRVFDATRDLVFQAWTGPQHPSRWRLLGNRRAGADRLHGPLSEDLVLRLPNAPA
jgi:uncharacterized protein YndB with AHSA1/START domain